MTTTDFAHIFGSARVMAILRGLPVAETVRLAERAWDLGIDVVVRWWRRACGRPGRCCATASVWAWTRPAG
ncbi:hypothetical protein [Micromonospora sp. NPDC005172]|uniref:hypothetical protein n=1 Tax=Micromonospora sp. NPDC005172 TaxID=3156867 RepID=UPI0033A9FA10